MSKSGDAFMKLDKTPYEGEFIGMCDGVIIAHSKSLDEVLELTIKACGSATVPFIAQVHTADYVFL